MHSVRLCLFAILVWLPSAALAATPALIPLPTSMVAGNGNFTIGEQTTVEGEKGAGPTAAYLSQTLDLKSSKDSGFADSPSTGERQSRAGPGGLPPQRYAARDPD